MIARSAKCLIILLALGTTAALAHPSVSVVMDRNGNVYYSDLKHVWKVAPDGSKSIAVPDVHTHELSIDPDGNLFGEHLWYEGERTDRWGHYVWRRSPDGTVTKVIPPREGFLTNYSFVRDRGGNMYWAERGRPTAIRKRTPAGEISTIATANFRNVRWMTATPAGTLFLIDYHDLIRITPRGEIRIIARRLSEQPRAKRRGTLLTRLLSQVFGDEHFLMGLWTGQNGDVYVARAGAGDVVRVTPGGAALAAISTSERAYNRRTSTKLRESSRSPRPV